ncbi:FAD:protein FMN transferase [Microcella alkalica]|uniref:FAD:protein FMN transferase n=1 Tax=Microcella alkalica TaxID=355930 RepID=UPI00145F4310|nr:FAD:protein FMN transferase [Microcella alkalica]
MPSPADAGDAWLFEAIGTAWRIDAARGLDDDDRSAVLARVERFDRDWSRFRDDSLVARIAAARDGGEWPLPNDAGPLLDLYERLHAATGGRVSPLVGASLERLGYDATYRLRPSGEPVPAPAWAETLDLERADAGAVRLRTRTGVLLDVGAAGKGYLVDLVGDLLAARGAVETVVDGSGDLRALGGAGIRVALENPANPTKAVGVVELRDAALAASSPSRRAWGEGLHHIIDAVTGRPVGGIIGTWVVAATALEADGLATALFVAEPAELEAAFDFTWVRMFSDGRLEASVRWEGELFR